MLLNRVRCANHMAKSYSRPDLSNECEHTAAGDTHDGFSLAFLSLSFFSFFSFFSFLWLLSLSFFSFFS